MLALTLALLVVLAIFEFLGRSPAASRGGCRQASYRPRQRSPAQLSRDATTANQPVG